MNSVLLVVSGVAAVGFGYYCYNRTRKKQIKKTKEELVSEIIQRLPSEHIETLQFSDVVNYFRGLSLQKGIDVPFIARTSKEGKVSYLLAAYNEKIESIKFAKLLSPNSIDSKLKETLGNEPLVVLS